MNENINLCTILKGHEGETFYSPWLGNITLTKIREKYVYPLIFTTFEDIPYYFTSDGKFIVGNINNDVECLIFPSKDQQDWGKWDKEHNNPPKTWDECCKDARVEQIAVTTDVIFDDNDKMIDNSDAVAKKKE